MVSFRILPSSPKKSPPTSLIEDPQIVDYPIEHDRIVHTLPDISTLTLGALDPDLPIPEPLKPEVLRLGVHIGNASDTTAAQDQSEKCNTVSLTRFETAAGSVFEACDRVIELWGDGKTYVELQNGISRMYARASAYQEDFLREYGTSPENSFEPSTPVGISLALLQECIADLNQFQVQSLNRIRELTIIGHNLPAASQELCDFFDNFETMKAQFPVRTEVTRGLTDEDRRPREHKWLISALYESVLHRNKRFLEIADTVQGIEEDLGCLEFSKVVLEASVKRLLNRKVRLCSILAASSLEMDRTVM
ncbi:hypothetical protein TWF730_008461 [Orbilia blumenaviensis]|uniref:Uncharacterized protein n=1 Tax=Orbilia blumenaviensis TaxID=1796055 RepID=A0AAV9V2F0_9PEZI